MQLQQVGAHCDQLQGLNWTDKLAKTFFLFAISLSPAYTIAQACERGKVFGSLLALHVPENVRTLNAYATGVGSPAVVTEEDFKKKRLDELMMFQNQGKEGVSTELGWSDEVSHTFSMGAMKVWRNGGIKRTEGVADKVSNGS